jgi:hypothetical protein
LFLPLIPPFLPIPMSHKEFQSIENKSLNLSAFNWTFMALSSLYRLWIVDCGLWTICYNDILLSRKIFQSRKAPPVKKYMANVDNQCVP